MSDQTETNENTSPETATEPAPSTGPIVARYDKWYRGKRVVVALALIVFGIWSIYHGFYLYPKENREWDSTKSAKPPHADYDAPFNKVAGIILPPLGIWMLVRLLRNSSRDIRLEDQTLYGPLHPPIPLTAIRKIDKRQWDRKGIAYLEYELGSPPTSGTFMLDNFLYEQQQIDEILRRIETFAGLEEPQPDTPASA
jgi:hypothetical protein